MMTAVALIQSQATIATVNVLLMRMAMARAMRTMAARQILTRQILGCVDAMLPILIQITTDTSTARRIAMLIRSK